MSAAMERFSTPPAPESGSRPLQAPLAQRLVFLVGPPRSGSTWLQSMLGTHPDIGTAQESHLFNHFLGPLIDSWQHLLDFDDGRGGIGLPAYLTQCEFDELLDQVCWSVYSKVPGFDRPVFLEKTPDHIRHIADIKRLLPGVRIVLLLRKPEDVIESLMSAGQGWGKDWASTSTFRTVRQYQYFFRNNPDMIEQPEAHGMHLVRYEQLKDDPARTLRGVLDYLQLSREPALIDRMVSSRLELCKYGEFARRDGHKVVEPEGFARKHKGRLNLLQRQFVNIALRQHRKALGY